jgi:predicted CXXCH cytochrome family protein
MRRKIFAASIVSSVLILIGAVVFWPGSTEALNPNHSGCSICHSIHGSPGQALTNDLSVEVLCLSCHGPAGISTLKADVHLNRPSNPPFRMTCMDCHNPHDNLPNWVGGTNLKMVGRKIDGNTNARISTPNSGVRDVAFESRGTNAGGPSLRSVSYHHQVPPEQQQRDA